MNKQEAKRHGVNNGIAAGRYCFVLDMDRREAGCGCVAPNHCEDCLTNAAYQAEQNARQYTPFEFFASACNKSGERAEGLWQAYESGVGVGIRKAIAARLQRDVEAARELQATVNRMK